MGSDELVFLFGLGVVYAIAFRLVDNLLVLWPLLTPLGAFFNNLESGDIGDLRKQAIERLEARRGFATHLTAYLLINTVLVAIWLVVADGGLFWPIFAMLGWGIGLVFHGLEAFRSPYSEDRIRGEMDRLSHGPR